MLEVDLSINSEKRIKKLIKDALRELVQECNKKDDDDKDKWVTTEEASKILGITPKHLRTIRDRFPHIRVGGEYGRLLFEKEQLLRCYIV